VELRSKAQEQKYILNSSEMSSGTNGGHHKSGFKENHSGKAAERL
jgi:hypothetical protein